MDIHSLMNSEPATREQPPRPPVQASPPPAQQQQQQHQQQQRQYSQHHGPPPSRGPSDHHGPLPPHHQSQQHHPGHLQQHQARYSPAQHHHHPPAPPPPPLPPSLQTQHSHQNQYQRHGPHPQSAPGPHHHLQSPARGSISGYPPPPPPIDTRSPSFSHPSANLQHTPIRTPQIQQPGQGQAQTPSQYPFPSGFQSPVQPHSNRNFDRVQAGTPSRSASQSYAVPHASSPLGVPPPPAPPSAAHSNASPTPPSAYVHSPHAMRESSLPGSHHPLAQNPYGPAPHHSQPTTPLGPPPSQLPRERTLTGRPEVSPYPPHHRTLSGASNSAVPSIASNSPGPPQRSSSQILESPANSAPNAIQLKRRSTEHIRPRSEREHSLSVSPKTQVSRGYPSGEQRHPSQDAWSARTSISHGRSELEMRHPSTDHAHPQHGPPPPILTRSSTSHLSQGAPSPLSQSQSFHHDNGQVHPPVANREIHHQQSREMSLDHINSPHPSASHKSGPEEFHHEYKARPTDQRPMVLQQPVSRGTDGAGMEPTQLKRRAEGSPALKEQKKPRIQHTEPPAWARLHPSNPAYQTQIARYPQLKGQMNSTTTPAVKREARTSSQAPVSSHGPPATAESGHGGAQPNGHPPVPGGSEAGPKKAGISRVLGMPWELSMTETLPADRLLHQIATFLYITMLSKPDLGAGDPRNGSLEIEAKVGTLVDKGTDQRLNLPVTTPCVLNEGFSRTHLRFESFMTESQHRCLNQTLNALIKRTMEPGRVRMQYDHKYEMDSFAALSQAGYAALPVCAKQELEHRKPPGALRLRTTVDNNPKAPPNAIKPVIAQIIKLRLADLDVFCPEDDFDVRISVNIEIDFHGRTDIDTSLLTQSEEKDSDRQPERRKNRLSYKHLTNSIDLTQVTYDAEGAVKTHELEIELDAATLRGQALLLKEGRDNAFEALVEKFWNDTLLLVRVKDDGGGGP